MSINNLFRIADAAKNCGFYDIANVCFAVLAYRAIEAQRYGSASNDAEARRVHFLYECAADDGDILGNLSDPDGAGYYDLPALSFYGPTLMGGQRESHSLCIPLPLVSRFFTNNMVRLIPRDDIYGTCWVERRRHERRHWRLSNDRRDAARRYLSRRVLEEATASEIDAAVASVLRAPVARTGGEHEHHPLIDVEG